MKIVIPVAGFGTRFLPVSKSVPKALMPVLDKPVIHHLVKEVISVGFQDIIIVTSPETQAVEDYFKKNIRLENHLRRFGKLKLLEEVRQISSLANFTFVRQTGRGYGTGYPILSVGHLVKNDKAFAICWGDDFFVGQPPRFKQILEVYEKYQVPVLNAVITDDQGTRRSAVVEGEAVTKTLIKVDKIVEKPGPQKTKSRIASVSGYILTPNIFNYLHQRKRSTRQGQELYLTDAISDLLKVSDVYAKIIKNKRIDCGTSLDWLKSNVIVGLNDKNTESEFREFIKSL